MRYSVVLPRVEATDAEDARRALSEAQELWTKGEQRAALEQVRHAAEAANATGQKARALALSRSVTMLARAIGSSSMPPPMVSEAPAVSAPRLKARPDVLASADTEPPGLSSQSPRNAPPRSSSGSAVPALQPQTPIGSIPSMPTISTTPQVRVSSPSLSSAQATPEVRLSAPALSAPAIALREPSSPSLPSAYERSTRAAMEPSSESLSVASATEESLENTELVVTVAPSDWSLSSHSALVGHSAQRVAVAPGRGPGGTLMVRPLAPGEVAPKGSLVAVMVALEPGALPLPRAG